MTKNEFKRIKKDLLALITPFGVVCAIKKEKFKYGRGFGVSGTYSAKTKRINLRIRGNCAYLEILATLAHEVRHAQHHQEGLFPEYYDPQLESKEYLSQIKQGLIIPPSVEIGLVAENDCNSFAREYLKTQGHPLNSQTKWSNFFYEPYPKYEVLTYRLRQLMPYSPVNSPVPEVLV